MNKFSGFVIINRKLYKKLASGPILQCFIKGQGAQVLREIHIKEFGNHSEVWVLMHKVLCQRYY